LTTRIYPARTDSTDFGIWVGDNSSVQVSNLRTWEITQNVFPERPVNSSSELVFDTPEETNDYVWWTGN
jgi:beta-fructofuranosidase